ncbi:hypothetical protein GCM10010440_07650 [Kitasatospora cinereorecta]
MLGVVGCIALYVAAGTVWMLVGAAVMRGLGVGVLSAVVGVGPPLHRHRGTRRYLEVRPVPIALRLTYDWPVRPGHARRQQASNLLSVAESPFCAAVGLAVLHGSTLIWYLVLCGVFGLVALFVVPTTDGRGQSRAQLLRRPPRAAEADSPTGLLRLRAEMAAKRLRLGDHAAAVRELAEIERQAEDGEDVLLRFDLMTYWTGQYLDVLDVYQDALGRSRPRIRRHGLTQLAADAALRAAEAGLLPVEDARSRAKVAVGEDPPGLAYGLQWRQDHLRALSTALGPRPEQAVRLARALIRRAATPLDAADAACTLALAHERSGHPDAAAAARDRARRLTPWLVRLHPAPVN